MAVGRMRCSRCCGSIDSVIGYVTETLRDAVRDLGMRG
jgi:hypothetical protein